MSTQQYDPSNPEPDNFEFPGYHGPQIRQTILDWFRANGVDTKYLPADPRATVGDGQLTFLSRVRGPGGAGYVIAPDDTVLTETVTVPVTVPPPPLVEKWLAPRCPSCGR